MTATNRILILFAHPALQKSRVNRALLEAIADLDGITINDLYEEYPDLHINVPREQQLLREHDIIVWQHPFFWYSSPAILKKWQDLVLSYGFAYGKTGDELQGKRCLSVISTGGMKETYCREGDNHYSMRELLVPFEQTARLCGMNYLPPFVIHGALKFGDRQQLDEHVTKYRQVLKALRQNQIQWENLVNLEYINDNLDPILSSPAEVPSA
ncbi:Kef-type potassium/proton antiporter accessory protein, CPA2 family [[Leptolyngbya] sp. PCC 7376]|uniref:glutathione-regulated potassium-efflux system oxidoreductase KefF n=1 Tax=[Leptolyngbya] sp. PCC 7376 TaxID=111781 RepID=UPI00029ED877|nr:NAD(P)H-dependent oxidoreductase [[Leptolyngbya] sp. PCC 7376]AFY40165.1 Kef-type potassium/proton antiporter accessory protein, CPA2 family [[Leptolyngbya] sp. PCC 7376]